MALPEGATDPLAQKLIASKLACPNVMPSEVAGMGANAPDGSEYVAALDSVSANIWWTALACVVGIYQLPLDLLKVVSQVGESPATFRTPAACVGLYPRCPPCPARPPCNAMGRIACENVFSHK